MARKLVIIALVALSAALSLLPGRSAVASGEVQAIAAVQPTVLSFSNGAERGAGFTGVAPRGGAAAYTVTIQRDGKIVVAGAAGNGWCDTGTCLLFNGLALARYLPNGRLDRSFGRAGRALTESGSELGYRAVAVAVQADGRILVAGENFKLFRYTRGGRLDPSFGKGGIAQAPSRAECSSEAHALAIQPDGRVVVAGECAPYDEEENWGKFLLARYTPAGHLDQTFGDGGSVLTDFALGMWAQAYAVAIQADGRIVVGGQSDLPPDRRDVGFALARYLPDGRLDASFGSAGRLLDARGRGASALALQPDGKIVAAGAGIARYASDGTPDRAFGGGGTVPTEFYVRGLAIQGDGKLVIAGEIRRRDQYDFVVRRYRPDGAPDAGFGSGGRVVTDFGAGSSDSAWEVALRRDGRIVVAGRREPEPPGRPWWDEIALAGYTTSGRLDRRFGTDGRVVTGFGAGVVGYVSFSATRTKHGVLVRWRTASEAGIRGFHIYRAPELRSFVRVTRKLIAGRASPTRGAFYTFRDRRAPKTGPRYRYLLQEVRRDGKTIWRGLAAVKR